MLPNRDCSYALGAGGTFGLGSVDSTRRFKPYLIRRSLSFLDVSVIAFNFRVAD
jgi:hypothetical protein